MRSTTRNPVPLLLLCLLAPLAVLPGRVAAQEASPPTLTPELERVRTALEKYQDPIMAVQDGYLSTVGCIDYPEGSSEGKMQYVPGGMGIHFLNPQLVGPDLVPTKPQVLIYEPDGQKLRLVAAEWFVPTQVAGSQRPEIFGRQLDGPMEGHEPIMPKAMHHYDLHVWLWKNNPAGVFSPTNPALTCPNDGYSFSEHTPKVVGQSGR